MSLAYDPGIAAFLEENRGECNRLGRLRRDPLALVVPYAEPGDRELAGLLASTLAFGSVDLILKACGQALGPLGPHPRQKLLAMTEAEVAEAWAGFQYRYCFSKDLVALLLAARRALEAYGSLEAFFAAGDPGGEDVVEATGSFARRLRALSYGPGLEPGSPPQLRPNLLPDSAQGSACKRLFLYLRWMVRQDEVDPGGWKAVDPSRLVVPMDTHMAKVAADRLHFLPKPKADLKAALAVTRGFRLYCPEDPVKYDFALTRPGIDPAEGDERFSCA